MTVAEIAPWVGTAAAFLGGGAGIVALIKAKPEARKVNAETANVIVDASGKLVQRLEDQIAKLSDKVEKLEQRDDEREKRDDLQDRRLRVHERWDQDVARQLRDLGASVPDPPPLYPATG